MTRYRRKFHRIARKLTNLELQQGARDFQLSMESVLHDLEESQGSQYFLGSYSEAGIMLALEKFGVCRELRRLGFENFLLHADTSDPYRQRLRLFYKRRDPRHLLGELIIHKATFTRKGKNHLPDVCFPLTMLHVEWLILQNPTGEFTPERPRLPGQEYPGLGVGSRVLEILYLMAKHQRTRGLLIVPHFYHTARLFSREFYFFNPEYQGLLNALARDLEEYSLPVQAWAVEGEAVRREREARRVRWQPEEQILPCDSRLKDYLESRRYRELVKQAENRYSFSVDSEQLAKALPPSLNPELDDDR